jgi:AbiJ N-terminal domain 4
MGILDTFSKRQKQLEKAGKQDVYQYDDLPQPFRVQVIHIWNGALGVFYEPRGYSSGSKSPANKYWRFIHDNLAREKGVFALGDSHSDSDAQCRQYLLKADILGALDIIEVSFA